MPVGLLLASLAAATLTPLIGWRGLFVVGAAPAIVIIMMRIWVPESPRWLLTQGHAERARESVAWALGVPAPSLPLPTPKPSVAVAGWGGLFRYPRSLAVSWLTNIGIQTGHYGMTMWAPTLIVLLLQIPPASAAWYMAAVGAAGLAGRFLFAWLSDRIGRRSSGILFGCLAAAGLLAAGILHDAFLGAISVFWLLLVVSNVFVDGGFAVVGPYAGEVWPSHLRTTGMGSAYGIGGIGKIIGPLGLAMIVGSSNVVTPQATLDAVLPAFAYLAGWFVLTAAAFALFGFETKGRSIEEIDAHLGEGASRGVPGPAQVGRS